MAGDDGDNNTTRRKPGKPISVLLTSMQTPALQPAVMLLPKAADTLLPPLPALTSMPLPPLTSPAVVRIPPVARHYSSTVVGQVGMTAATVAATWLPPAKSGPVAGCITMHNNKRAAASSQIKTAVDSAAAVGADDAANVTMREAGSSMSSYTRSRLRLSDASLRQDSSDTMTAVTAATPEAARSGTVTITAPLADTVSAITTSMDQA